MFHAVLFKIIIFLLKWVFENMYIYEFFQTLQLC